MREREKRECERVTEGERLERERGREIKRVAEARPSGWRLECGRLEQSGRRDRVMEGLWRVPSRVVEVCGG